MAEKPFRYPNLRWPGERLGPLKISPEEFKTLYLAAKKKKNKYKATSVTIDDLRFDSKREANRWAELLLLHRAGKIQNLERQVSFDLRVRNIKIGRYQCDFRYETATGQTIIEDVKAERKGARRSATATPLYRRSKKHFEAQYGLKITEV